MQMREDDGGETEEEADWEEQESALQEQVEVRKSRRVKELTGGE